MNADLGERSAADYLDALSRGDRRAAQAVVETLRRDGMSPLDVMTQVIAPAQYRVGELWADDSWSVAQEHAATAVSESVLAVLAADSEAPSLSGAPVVVSCVEQEWHALPAALVAAHLRTAGIPVSYLGANSSADQLVRHVHELGPRAVALSCSLGASLPRVRRQIEAVRATGTPVIVGGSAFDPAGRRAATLGATAYAATGALAVPAVLGLPHAVPPADPLTHPGADEAVIVQAEREVIAANIRRRVFAAHPSDDPAAETSGWRKALTDHLPHLVGAVAGALVADDATVLDDAVSWLDHVLSHRAAPSGLTDELVQVLAAELREHPVAARLLSRA